MRRLAITAFLFSTVALLDASTARAQQQQQGQTAPSVSATTRKQVLDFVRAYTDAQNRADATALSDAISRRSDVTSVNDGKITRGWDAIRAETDQITGKEGTFRVDVGTMDVVSVDATHVLVIAPTTVTLSTQQGPRQITGAMTLVLEKGADGWKILNEHYSSKPQ